MLKNPQKIAVFHIEDDFLWVEFVKKICLEDDLLSYCGSAGTLQEGLMKISTCVIDVLILDCQLPDSSPWETIRRAETISRATKVVLLTVQRNDMILYSVVTRPCVWSLVWKDPKSLCNILAIVRGLHSERRVLPDTVRDSLAAFRNKPLAFYKLLSFYDMEIIDYVCRGLDDAALAERLGIGRSTAKSHRLRIIHKLNLETTEQLIVWAGERGFLPVQMLAV